MGPRPTTAAAPPPTPSCAFQWFKSLSLQSSESVGPRRRVRPAGAVTRGAHLQSGRCPPRSDRAASPAPRGPRPGTDRAAAGRRPHRSRVRGGPSRHPARRRPRGARADRNRTLANPAPPRRRRAGWVCRAQAAAASRRARPRVAGWPGSSAPYPVSCSLCLPGSAACERSKYRRGTESRRGVTARRLGAALWTDPWGPARAGTVRDGLGAPALRRCRWGEVASLCPPLAPLLPPSSIHRRASRTPLPAVTHFLPPDSGPDRNRSSATRCLPPPLHRKMKDFQCSGMARLPWLFVCLQGPRAAAEASYRSVSAILLQEVLRQYSGKSLLQFASMLINDGTDPLYYRSAQVECDHAMFRHPIWPHVEPQNIQSSWNGSFSPAVEEVFFRVPAIVFFTDCNFLSLYMTDMYISGTNETLVFLS